MKIWEFEARTFGDTLRALREDKNMTRKELAERLKYTSASSINNYEQGVTLPTLAGLMNLARVLGVDEIRIDARKGGKLWN